MKRNAWIVVANHDKARILTVESVGLLKEFKIFHASHNHSAQNQKPGRKGESMIRGLANAFEPRTTPQKKDSEDFARQIAYFLEQARGRNEYDNLYLVAEARFLGNLRPMLSTGTLHLVAGEVAKDLVGEEPRDLWMHLPFAV